MIKKSLTLLIITFSLISTIIIVNPVSALSNSSQYVHPKISTNYFAAMDYEVKEKTTLEDPIIDPNFNVMRNQELGKSKAIPLVVGVLILAIIAPIATWYYFKN